MSHHTRIEATLALAAVAQRYGMDDMPGHPVVPDPAFTPRPKHGNKVVLRRRG